MLIKNPITLYKITYTSFIIMAIIKWNVIGEHSLQTPLNSNVILYILLCLSIPIKYGLLRLKNKSPIFERFIFPLKAFAKSCSSVLNFWSLLEHSGLTKFHEIHIQNALEQTRNNLDIREYRKAVLNFNNTCPQLIPVPARKKATSGDQCPGLICVKNELDNFPKINPTLGRNVPSDKKNFKVRYVCGSGILAPSRLMKFYECINLNPLNSFFVREKKDMKYIDDGKS